MSVKMRRGREGRGFMMEWRFRSHLAESDSRPIQIEPKCFR